MMCSDAESHLLAYHDGALADEVLRAHIDTCPACQQALTALDDTQHLLQRSLTVSPSPELRTAFYTMLAAEKAKLARSPKHRWLGWWQRLSVAQLATALAIMFGLGFAVSAWLLSEPTLPMDRNVVALLEQSSPVDRLAGVYATLSLESNEARTVALVDLLAGEPNVNVQVAALDVLRREDLTPEVAEAVSGHLTPSADPVVQAALLRFVAQHPSSENTARLRVLLAASELEPLIRQEAERLLNTLTI